MGLVPPEELLSLIAQARAMRQKFRAFVRGHVPGPVRVRVRSLFRTHDRLGGSPWQPGDSPRLLVLRDWINRDQLITRTYIAQSEVYLRVIIDGSESLLGHAQTGPFAVKLGCALAAAAIWERQPTGVSFLRGIPPAMSASRPRDLGGLVDQLSRLEPQAVERANALDAVERLERDFGRPRANTNCFLLTHAGHPLKLLERILRAVAARAGHAVAFLIVAEEELYGAGQIADPESGAWVDTPADRASRVAEALDHAIALGRWVGVPVQPLIVRNHAEDIETLMPLLASVT
jgi:hypothetical protein